LGSTLSSQPLDTTTFSVQFSGSAYTGKQLVVTLSDEKEGTSEFSDCLTLVNQPPFMSAISPLSGTEDTTVDIHYADLLAASDASDANGDTFVFQIENIASGSVTINGAPVGAGATLQNGEHFVWKPVNNVNGSVVAFSLVADDGALNSSPSAPLSVTLKAVDDPPRFTTDLKDKIINEKSPLFFEMEGEDTEGDPFEFKIASGALKGMKLDGGKGKFSWKPSFEQQGDHPVTFRIESVENPNLFSEKAILISVIDVDQPYITLKDVTVNEVDGMAMVYPTLNGVSDEEVRVTCQILQDTAKAPEDFIAQESSGWLERVEPKNARSLSSMIAVRKARKILLLSCPI